MEPLTGKSPVASVMPAEALITSIKPSMASQRLRSLAALSGSLTDALTPESAADLVEQKALSAMGATSAVVVTLGSFPPSGKQNSEPDPSATLHVVHAVGLPAEVKAALEAQPLDAPLPFAVVARDGQPLFLESDSALLGFPEWGASMILAGAHSAAVVPVWANGELRGVLGLSWPDPQDFDEDERAFVLTLGVMCAQAIMRAHLKAAEKAAREGAERAQSIGRTRQRFKSQFRRHHQPRIANTNQCSHELYGAPVTRTGQSAIRQSTTTSRTDA